MDRIMPMTLCLGIDSGVIDLRILVDEFQTAGQTVTGTRPLIDPRFGWDDDLAGCADTRYDIALMHEERMLGFERVRESLSANAYDFATVKQLQGLG
jgi:hypothetical protein